MQDYLEYWCPPLNSHTLQASIFTRVAIPLEMDSGVQSDGHFPSNVLNVHIETIGGPVLKNFVLDTKQTAADPMASAEVNSNTLIVIVSDNRHVQTWQPVLNLVTQEKTLQLCGDLILCGNVGSFHPYEVSHCCMCGDNTAVILCTHCCPVCTVEHSL